MSTGPETSLPADILEATAAFVEVFMADDLASVDGQPAVWADEYPPLTEPPLPYALVLDGVENYEFSSQDPATGYFNQVISDGTISVAFHAATKQDVRDISLLFIQRCALFAIPTVTENGRIIDFLPMSSQTVVPKEVAPASPTVYVRVVVIHYKLQGQG